MRSFNVVMCNHYGQVDQSLGLVDSGADTCMLGPEFFIESQSTTRKVNIEGFQGSTNLLRDMPIGVGITAVDIPDEPTILLSA